MNQFRFMIPEEFIQALYDVHLSGVQKYGDDIGDFNWLESNAPKTDHKSMHDSIFHHLAESYSGTTEDKESKLPPAYHAAYRLMMLITRMERNIKHEKDI